MRTLSYSPSIEAYVAVSGKDGAVTYYDISPDISNCRVSRQENGISTFSIKLQNKGGKYNNLFTPMDRVTIYANKRGVKQQLLTGYINSVTRFTLYPQDFSISGSCSIYRLQKLYWDSGLVSSYSLFADGDELSISKNWTNYSSLIYKLVCVVGGMPSNILIGDVPQSVVDWAMALFAAKQSDYEDMRSRIEAFYEVLSSTNMGVVGGVSAGGGQAGAKAIEDAVEWMLKIAADDRIGYDWYKGRGEGILEGRAVDLDCSSLIFWGLVASGGWTREELGGTPFSTYTMTDILTRNGFTKVGWDGNASSLTRGDILWSNSHTEMYIGNNQTVGAHIAETGDVTGKSGDQTGNEVSVSLVGNVFSHYFRFTGKKG